MLLGVCLGALALTVFSLASSTTEMKVDVFQKHVNLSCSTDNPEWKIKEWSKYKPLHKSGILTIPLSEGKVTKGQYSCVSKDDQTSRIYLQIKACEDCVELSTGFVAGIVIADLLITCGVLFLVYYFSKSRGGAAGGGPRTRTQGPKGDCPPPVPNPDYEPIRKGQREVYAGLEARAF
ncbi:T-cell surface glycoprotein CD3 epsilon chain [Rhineura floridana]|uniref:T-cell surface glycoprotein CD3 epsilon chain n=1 Tax=Rhineura floridana TaxID=261503 RepID=UPI002AC83D8F|nr:T-cell surface glycoprotein CD3 epsilon chain [Rhineura floridana]